MKEHSSNRVTAINKIWLGILLFFLVSVPATALSAPLVPCGLSPGTGVTKAQTEPCEFKHAIELVQSVINFIIVIAAPIAAIMFAYAGWLYITAGGDTGKVSKAHSIFWTVFVGFVIMLSAWLIVKYIGDALAEPKFTELLGK